MTAWPHDKRAELDAFYGHPGSAHLDTRWAANNLVHVDVPWQMTYAGKPVRTIQIHEKCADSLKRVLAAIWTACGQDQAKVAATGLNLYGGSFCFRPVRGASTLSCHAYAAAIDFDPAHEQMGTSGRMAKLVIDAFKHEGWFWGGDFVHRKDPMHFQATTGA